MKQTQLFIILKIGKKSEIIQRHRRRAGEINRHYICPVSSCQKSYGSEGSLSQHVKVKHPQYKEVQKINSDSQLDENPKKQENFNSEDKNNLVENNQSIQI